MRGRWRLVLPWRYLVMLAIGLVVLFLLLARYGRSAPVLVGWLAGWLILSRGIDFLIRSREKPLRFRDQEESSSPPQSESER